MLATECLSQLRSETRSNLLAWLLVPLVFGTLLVASNSAQAALPDEIQVYLDDLNSPDRLSVQLHINTTPAGIRQPEYAGETLADHGWRFTSEFALGLTNTLEAGMYLPLVRDSSGVVQAAGGKLRLKWVPVRPSGDEAGVFLGLNGELSRVQHRFESSQNGFELRPIIGWHDDVWLIAANPVLGFALSQPQVRNSPTFEPSWKLSRTATQGISVGIEYYGDDGTLAHPRLFSQNSQTLYAAIDIDRKPWVLNFGIGRGLTAIADRWTVKLIVEIPLDHK